MGILKVAVKAILVLVLLLEVEVGDGHRDSRLNPVSRVWLLGDWWRSTTSGWRSWRQSGNWRSGGQCDKY